MEKALEVRKGKERLVSAREMQREYHGRTPRGVRFICPLCRQPLFPAAMSPGCKQSPHFRHGPNNERAQECELFASKFGYYTTYQRVPMPMFIRKSRSQIGRFIVEGGFRKLDPSTFSKLEYEEAVVAISQKRYKVTSQRFNGGLTKLPFEEISLSCGSSVRLINTSLSLNATWGYPEDATQAMVFTRDVDSNQGKRLKKGDTLVFENDFYLLAPERESGAIERAFSGSRQVGYAGSRTTHMRLSVFEVTLSKKKANWQVAKQYLEECGFETADSGDTPELIWPPSLKSGGDLVPLFDNSRCIFEASLQSSNEGRLFVHTNADTANRVQTVMMRKVGATGYGFSVLRNTANLSFVTTRNWVFSTAVLLQPSDSSIAKWLGVQRPLQVTHSLGDGGNLELTLGVPGLVLLLRKGAFPERFKANEETYEYSISATDSDAVRVLLPLGASLDDSVAYEYEFVRLAGDGNTAAPKLSREMVAERLLASDVQRAINRAERRKVYPSKSLTESIATVRRNPR